MKKERLKKGKKLKPMSLKDNKQIKRLNLLLEALLKTIKTPTETSLTH